MKADIYNPVTVTHTVVYNSKGEEIARHEGEVPIRPNDYEDQLPVEYRVIETTTRVITKARIEK